MHYLVRFLLLVLAVVCLLGARRVSRAPLKQEAPTTKSTGPVAQTFYLPQTAK
ncbi:MAG: hypothetical protein ACRYFX_02955 [Janthinobacterium lividum]